MVNKAEPCVLTARFRLALVNKTKTAACLGQVAAGCVDQSGQTGSVRFFAGAAGGTLQEGGYIISKNELQINEEIRDKEVRVIDADGTQLGVMPLQAAMKIAADKNLDLVKIAPQAQPPVCKVIDYGKYRFEQAKREKEARKNQKVVEVKEIRLSLNIDTHDFETKAGHANRFIADGNKVKVSIRFRGREMGHPEHGVEIMKKFAAALAEVANVEKQPKLEGRSMQMFLAPKPTK